MIPIVTPANDNAADVLRQKREAVLRPKAKEQQGTRTDLQPSPNLGGGSERRTAKVAATGTGYSGSTLDKVRAIRDAAERGVVRQGDREVPAPTEVREIARAGVENVKQRVGHGRWLDTGELLPFGERTAQRLMLVARHPDLSDPTHGSHLPASWRTLDVLAQLPPGEVDRRIEAGEITPELDRATAQFVVPDSEYSSRCVRR